eukprot:CAMPEP_0178915792 /NCGR_PEP_ID=MMETSP0786-20121207/12240_1 /TAXON_ID=186022 /ORGANISM="Thalassionema frauenfeldii, Strain CCMP 1798" /LENGTH=362 /DNA_ID=CAMNT_0020588975 /DNA_START=19 /DNA_END=1108 /DNA_ORIENTATION=-
MSSSVCANHGRSVCSDSSDLSEMFHNLENKQNGLIKAENSKKVDGLIKAENNLLKKEEVWVFDMPNEKVMDEMDEINANGGDDLLEDFPDSKDKDGCGESELYEDFPNRYECDDDDDKSVFSVAKSVSSVLSALSQLSFGSRRSARSKKGLFGNSSRSGKEQSEKTVEMTDDSTFNQQDAESENKEALAMIEDQTEFFENDPVDKLVHKMTYSSNRTKRLPPVKSSIVEEKSSQLPSDNDEIKNSNENPLEDLMKKLKPAETKEGDDLEDSFSLLAPDLLYEADQVDDTEQRQHSEKTDDIGNDKDELGELPNDDSFSVEDISGHTDISNISLMKMYGHGAMPPLLNGVSDHYVPIARAGHS